ncbi:MAG: FlgD immunoglobulin-like domain containing protein [bacterium]
MTIALCFLLLAAVAANAGGPLQVYANRAVVYRNTAFPLVWQLDPGALGNYTNAQAAQIVADAFAAWESVPTATPSFRRGADLPSDITTSNYNTYWDKFADGFTPVILDSDGAILDDLRGLGAKNNVVGLAASAYPTGGANAGFYAEGVVLINGFLSDRIPLLQYFGVVKHEIGHLIGLDHAQIGKSEGSDGDDSNDAAVPLMFPITTSNFEFTADDILAVSNLYPVTGFYNGRGTLRGTIRRRDATLVRGANVIAINTANPGERYSTVTDYFGNAPGLYELKGLPPGNYHILAEPVVARFNSGSSVGPYAKNSGDLSFINPAVFEYYSSANESYDHLADQPNDRVTVTVAANQITANIDFLGNDPPNQILNNFTGDAAAFVQIGQSTTYNAAAVRFTPTRSGQLLWMRLFFNGTRNGIQGNGSMRFTVSRPNAADPSSPGVSIDQIDVPLKDLTKGLSVPYELWLGGRNLAVTAGQDFFVSTEIVGDGAAQLLLASGTAAPFRNSMRSSAGVWSAIEQIFQRPGNLMMAVAIGGEAQEVLPLQYTLEQNYPNPFVIGKNRSSGLTTIRFVLPQDARAEVAIFDRLGQQVRVLNNEIFPQGYNLVFWDGKDENGFRLPSGIYFYRVRSGSFEQVRTLTLMK